MCIYILVLIWQESIEVIFMVIFTSESAIKIIAHGMWQHQEAYLRNPANFLDFTIVMIGFFDMLMSSLDVEGVDAKALRAFRVLRPLRLVSGVPSKYVISFIMIAVTWVTQAAGHMVFFILWA